MRQQILIGSLVGAVAGAAAALAFPSHTRPKNIQTPAAPVDVPATPVVESRAASAPARTVVSKTVVDTSDVADATRRYRASSLGYTKLDDLVKDNYWNTNNITLDATQQDALKNLMEEYKRSEAAAQSQWMGTSGPYLQKSIETGRYTKALAKPLAEAVSMLDDSDATKHVANQTSSTPGPGFQLVMFTALPAGPFPSVAAAKRNYEDQKLLMHDALKEFFKQLK